MTPVSPASPTPGSPALGTPDQGTPAQGTPAEGTPTPEAPAPGLGRLPNSQTVGRPCSVAAALALVGEKWALLAVREIAYGNHRFDAIARNTGAPRDILTARLRSLEGVGILARRQYQDRPARFEYHLSAAGRDLRPLLQMLAAWGDKWVSNRPPVVFGHGDHELEVAVMCRLCGEEVLPGSVHALRHAPGWERTGPVAS